MSCHGMCRGDVCIPPSSPYRASANDMRGKDIHNFLLLQYFTQKNIFQAKNILSLFSLHFPIFALQMLIKC